MPRCLQPAEANVYLSCPALIQCWSSVIPKEIYEIIEREIPGYCAIPKSVAAMLGKLGPFVVGW